jgi:hypothetical protein
MTPRVPTNGRRAARCGRLIALAALILTMMSATATAAPLPADLRACIERNAVRYLPPETSLAGQYADIEAACRSALGKGAVTADFVGDPTTSGSPRSAGDADLSSPSARPSGARPPGGGVRASGASGSPTSTGGTAAAVGDSAIARVVREEPTVSAGSPLPTSLTGAPLWLMIAFAMLAGVTAFAILRTVRRRSG